MNITIHYGEEQGKLEHFWRSTGFTPAELLITRDMKQALTYAGSVPHHGIQYVRIHYLLELVKVASHPGEPLSYDWTLLDEGLDDLVRSGLKPFFEVMGNPGNRFTDFTDDRQIHQWKDMVTCLALHLIARYGRQEVESWYFESWNEPDGGWWPQWPHDETSFCNYYDACSEGLLAADPKLIFGGPGTCMHLSSLLKAFLAHCDSGSSYFTGENAIRLDFISVHEKGGPATQEDINPNSGMIWRREAEIIQYIRDNHPRLAGVPFMNNECDPQVGWQHIHTWRARPYYAAMVCKVIHQHQLALVDSMQAPYALLGNDNGFIGAWGNRTLVARFGDPGLLEDGQSGHTPRIVTENGVRIFPPFELIKKPVLNVMVMLSLLGDTRCKVSGLTGDPDAPLGVIATRRGSDQVAVLLYHSRDRIMSSGEERISLRLEGLSFREAVLAHYRIDDHHGDPFTAWEQAGAPECPGQAVYEIMRREQELAYLEEPRLVQVTGGELAIAFDLPLPAVSLVVLTGPSAEAPGPVQDVRLERYQGLGSGQEVMVTWQGLDSHALRTYEVLAAPAPGGPYRRVNRPDLLCTAFLHVRETGSSPLFYKVRAVDYWGRAGAGSEAISLAE